MSIVYVSAPGCFAPLTFSGGKHTKANLVSRNPCSGRMIANMAPLVHSMGESVAMSKNTYIAGYNGAVSLPALSRMCLLLP